MRKKIGIDMRMMKPFPTGIGSHYIQLVSHLVQLHPENEYILIVNDRCEAYIKKYFVDSDVIYEKINILGGSFKQHLLWIYIRHRISRLHLDVLVTDLWSSFIGIPCPYALMVYDLIGFHHVSKVSLKQRLYDIFLYKVFAKHANVLIASGESVKKDLIDFFYCDEKKIHIVMPSVAPEYTQDLVPEEVSAVLEKYHLKAPYIVYIGNRRPHKNIEGALRTYYQYRKHHPQSMLSFVLIGGFDTEKDQSEDKFEISVKHITKTFSKDVHILGKVFANEDVHAILAKSLALFHPSKFEGYGITPLEAMYAKTVVIASNIAPIVEVTSHTGMLYDFDDSASFEVAIDRIAQDEAYRMLCIDKAFIRANEITWQKASDDFAYALSCVNE